MDKTYKTTRTKYIYEKHKKDYKRFVEVLGWMGLVLILIGFRLASTGQGTGLEYKLVNLFGAGMLVWNCYENKIWPIMILNGILFVMAGWSLM